MERYSLRQLVHNFPLVRPRVPCQCCSKTLELAYGLVVHASKGLKGDWQEDKPLLSASISSIPHFSVIRLVKSSARAACLRIVDVRGIMGRACAKQWGAHVQSNGLRMCKAMACAWRWLYLLANTSAPLKDQSLMLSLSCMDMVSPDKLSRLLLSMKPVQLNNLSASVLVAKTQRYFLASLHRLGNCGLLGLNQSKGSSPSSRAFSERSCLLLLC